MQISGDHEFPVWHTYKSTKNKQTTQIVSLQHVDWICLQTVAKSKDAILGSSFIKI